MNVRKILKNGDYVTNRNKETVIYAEKFAMLLYDDSGYTYLSQYDEDLKCEAMSSFDIMKIERDGVIIWERKEYVTVNEAFEHMKHTGKAKFDDKVYILSLGKFCCDDGGYSFSEEDTFEYEMLEPKWLLV